TPPGTTQGQSGSGLADGATGPVSPQPLPPAAAPATEGSPPLAGAGSAKPESSLPVSQESANDPESSQIPAPPDPAALPGARPDATPQQTAPQVLPAGDVNPQLPDPPATSAVTGQASPPSFSPFASLPGTVPGGPNSAVAAPGRGLPVTLGGVD